MSLLVIALPHAVLSLTTAAWIVSIFQHFIAVKDVVTIIQYSLK
jgi:hypothetical protein